MHIDIDKVCDAIKIINSFLVVFPDGKYKNVIHITDNNGEGWHSFNSELVKIKYKGLRESAIATILVGFYENDKITKKKMAEQKRSEGNEKLNKFYDEIFFDAG